MDLKKLQKEAKDWELELTEIWGPGEQDDLVGYSLDTFEDRSVGWYGFNLGEFDVKGFHPTKLSEYLEYFKDEPDVVNEFEKWVQKVEKEVKEDLKSETLSKYPTLEKILAEQDAKGMALSDLDNIYRKAEYLHGLVHEVQEIPPWVLEKLAIIRSSLSEIMDFIAPQSSSGNPLHKE